MNTQNDEQKGIQQTIIDELGLSDLPEEKKEELLLKMLEAVLKRISLEINDRLNEKDQAEYEKMIEENTSPEILEGFLRERISNYDTMIQKIVTEFKEQMKMAI